MKSYITQVVTLGGDLIEIPMVMVVAKTALQAATAAAGEKVYCLGKSWEGTVYRFSSDHQKRVMILEG